MMTQKMTALAAVLALSLACSGGDTVDDPTPMEEDMADYGDDFDMSEDDAEEVELSTEEILQAAADGSHRSEEDRARNLYRNPVETLTFFGFEPGQKVVEIWPGAGWYTGVLAPATGDDTTLTAAVYAVDEDDPEDYRTQVTTKYLEWIDAHGEVLGSIETVTLDPPEQMTLGEPGSADLVVTFRSMHNMYNGGVIEDTLEGIYDVLKMGGTLGVVQHRAPEGSDPEETAPNGYLPQNFVIEVVEAAGFELVETSEINANPEDTADHEDGVWALPPSLRGGEETAEEFEAIGESDRMTLRFEKVARDAEADTDTENSDSGDDGDSGQ